MVALALLQGSSDTGNTMLIVLGVLALVVFVVLGTKFFVNLFEVITAPGASLKHHGENDTAFYSLAIVFLGSLIGSFIMVLNQAKMRDGFHEFAVEIGSSMASGNRNETYHQIASEWATTHMDNQYFIYVDSNLMMLGFIGILFWVVAGLIFMLAAKMFASTASFSDLLSATAYPMFFGIIGQCCALADQMMNLESAAQGYTPDSISGMGILGIIGAVLSLYATVLYLLAFMQATDLGFGQVIVGIILYLVIMGGIQYLVMTKVATPAIDEFTTDVVTLDPSRANYKLPGESSR